MDILKGVDGIFGARMMGAGFSGSVIALVKTEQAEIVRRTVSRDYHPGGLKASAFLVRLTDGARMVQRPHTA